MTDRWQPVTVPVKAVPYDGLEFVLTPYERDQATLHTLALERNRRRRNRADDARGLVDAIRELEAG